MRSKRIVTFTVAAVTLLAATTLLAAMRGLAAKLEIGDDAPAWSGIIGIDDQKHGLSDYKRAKLIVLVFTCNSCPVAQAYEDRLVALQKAYGPKGVRVIAANVNNLDDDKLDKMKDRAKEKKFNFPYLYDPTQEIARDYGATVTPHVFVLDGRRKVVYMGAVDDSMKPDGVKHPFLKNALDALLAEKEPPQTVTRQFGCGIKYEK